jgi:hypothetical protein
MSGGERAAGEVVRRTIPFTVSDGQRYSAATRNSASGRTISRKAKSALDM